MSYYVTDFNKIRNEQSILNILEGLERAFLKFGIDYYLIGALARDVWMRGVFNINPKRATSDIDFGVWIKNSTQFDELKKHLVEFEGFTESTQNPFALIAKDGRVIDLLPFGYFEKEGKLAVKGTGMTNVRLDGLREVYEAGSDSFNIEDKISFKVCTLPGIVTLKFISWDDRPEIRVDDLGDIAEILLHFYDIFDEIIWSEHSDLFVEGRELIQISARVLGREMGRILSRNNQVMARILAIFPAENPEKASRISRIISGHLQLTLDQTNELLVEIEKGILERDINIPSGH
jgi:predicted nucleotidyltransferase